MTGSTGTLTANEIYGFRDLPYVVGGSTLTTRVGFDAAPINVNNIGTPADGTVLGAIFGLTGDAGLGTVTNNIGFRSLRDTRGTNVYAAQFQNTVQLWDDTSTFTANPTPMVNVNGTHTMNVANGVYPTTLAVTSLVKWQTQGVAFGGWTGITMSPTHQAFANSENFIGGAIGMTVAPTFDASTFTGTGAGFYFGYTSTPMYTRSGSGVVTASSATGFSSGATVGTGNTVTTVTGFAVSDATGGGTVTNQYGIQIPNLVKGGTKNRAIQIGSTSTVGNSIEMAQQSANDTTTTLPASSMSMYNKGGNICFAWNAAGTMHFLFLPLQTDATTTWTHNGTGP